MGFSEFNKSSILTESGVFMLKEGIDHIESLPHEKFINTVKNLSQFIVSEKLDGSNLVFGFEEDGKFYTSREAKSGGRNYSVDDYSDRAADNGFKSAHAALEQIKPELKAIVEAGGAVEVEILFGRQPNAIVYGSNYVAFLRMLPGDKKEAPDQTKIKELGKKLKSKQINVTVSITTTKDGIDIKSGNVKQQWKFESVAYVDSHHFAKVDVKKEIDGFEKWLKKKHEVGITNGDLLTVKLTSIPKSDRAEIKKAREEAIDAANNKFKLPIKEKFLDEVLRKLAPALRDVDIEPHENLGIEGVVLLNPSTLEQLKIVDKDVFTTINQFNHAIRNQIKFAVGKRPEFGEAAKLPIQDDVFGDMLKKIEQITGLVGVGKYAGIKRAIRKLAGKDDSQTIKNVAKEFHTKDVNDAKSKVGGAINEGIDDLNKSLDHYKANWKKITIKLQTGVDTKYTDEIHKRTLMVFAEVRKELQDMLKGVQNAKTIGDIVVALFGRQIREIH